MIEQGTALVPVVGPGDCFCKAPNQGAAVELMEDYGMIALTVQNDLDAALKREHALVVNIVRWMEMAEGHPKWQHLDDTVLLAQMAEEIEQALEPYRVEEQAP